jgi:hypothetical protein
MEIRVGIRNSARELSFESNASAKEIEASVDAALTAGAKTIKPVSYTHLRAHETG